jgi:hypothetical protein
VKTCRSVRSLLERAACFFRGSRSVRGGIDKTDYNCRMDSRRFKYEGWLYGLAFLLALGLRLTQLGAMPLSDAEAEPALQALRITQGLRPALSPHPAYILLTAPIFFLFAGATDFLARLIPALAGSALVFAPLLFQNHLKPRASLILALCFAFEPGLTALSRQAASSILAIAFVLFAWGFWIQNKPRLAGGLAAFALLSGPSIWAGLLGLGITWAIRQGMEFRPDSRGQRTAGEKDQPADPQLSPASQLLSTNLKPSVYAFVAVLILGGTLLFLIPNGLSAALASLPAYMKYWSTSSGVPSSRLFFSLLVYQLPGVLLAGLAIGRGWKEGSRRIIHLSLWLLVALLLAVFTPSHQISDLAWTLLPLWTLAALELARYLNVLPEERAEVIGVVLLTAFIAVFTWLDLTALIWLPPNSQQYALRSGLLFGALFLFVISILLVAMGWSVRTAHLGAVWGLVFAMGLFNLGGTLGAAGLRGAAFPELWWSDSLPAQTDLLAATVADLSEWGTGDDKSLPVLITGIDSPALEWTLRDHQVKLVESLDTTASPPFIITPLQEDPGLVNPYRGQDFSWRQTPSWETAFPKDWLRWIALREMPQTSETIILWVRDDLFLDASTQTSP